MKSLEDEFKLNDKKIELKWNNENKISSFSNFNDSTLLRNNFKIYAEPSKTCITSKKQNKILIPPFIISAFDTMYLFQLNAIDIIDQFDLFLIYYNEHQKDFKFKVFKDLKSKNYFVLSGFKYGTDFIVYTDDPNFVHSDYLVNCFKKDDELDCKTIITNERIGVVTRKKLVYAFVNEKEDDNLIEYFDFTWFQI